MEDEVSHDKHYRDSGKWSVSFYQFIELNLSNSFWNNVYGNRVIIFFNKILDNFDPLALEFINLCSLFLVVVSDVIVLLTIIIQRGSKLYQHAHVLHFTGFLNFSISIVQKLELIKHSFIGIEVYPVFIQSCLIFFLPFWIAVQVWDGANKSTGAAASVWSWLSFAKLGPIFLSLKLVFKFFNLKKVFFQQ